MKCELKKLGHIPIDPRWDGIMWKCLTHHTAGDSPIADRCYFGLFEDNFDHCAVDLRAEVAALKKEIESLKVVSP